MNTIFRLQVSGYRCQDCHPERSEGSSAILLCILAMLFAACDFHGPWEYYPEEREVYTGIYTYGYIMDRKTPYVCFSKVYELEETSSQNFAFYDSAMVTVQGRFYHSAVSNSSEIDTTISLRPETDRPNCFEMWHSYLGMSGEKYTLNAFFVWDSAGHKVKSRYKAEATIPNAVNIKGLNVPKQDGSYQWISNKSYETKGTWGGYANFTVEFLEYPMDMEFIKCALDFDNTVGGVLSVLNYDIDNMESVNTTVNKMFKGLTEADSAGYRGLSMHDPLEKQQSFGYTENRKIVRLNDLDTLYLMNMMLPIGEVYVDLYATDRAYVDYVRKVKASVSDSRVIPESNIENGMGVFSGMAVSRIKLDVLGEGVNMDHVAWFNCDAKGGMDTENWETRGCRLYQDVTCSGMAKLGGWEDLITANEHAYEQYRDSVYNRNVDICYPSNVKAAMMLDTTNWSLFLPDSIEEDDKSEAYTEGLKRYCVASNFKSNHIADCSALKKECLEGTEKNVCKEYLWEWCADRNWNMSYEQCRSAFVSRYYIEELKSSILKREVENVCNGVYSELVSVRLDSEGKEIFDVPICENWCKHQGNHVVCQ